MTAEKPENKLAFDGGVPAVHQQLPPMYPGGMRIDEEEEQAVLEVIRSKRLFRYYGPYPGPSKVEELEKTFSDIMQTKYAVAVNSGTSALISGLAGIGIGPEDEVIVPAYTWIASASAVVAMGAVPILAEVDDSLTLDPIDVEAKITPYTKAIMPVHMRGAPSKMNELMNIARKHHLKVIEDTAQADGASYKGKRLGSIGDVGAFSLQFNKILTCGEGGMVITNNEEVYDRVLMYHDVVGGLRNKIPAERILPGINFRMPELLGAVMLVQIKRLDLLLATMRRNKQMLKDSLVDVTKRKGITFRTINDPGDASIALIFFMPDSTGAHMAVQALEAEGAEANVMFAPDKADYHIYYHWAPIMNQHTWTSTSGPWRNHPRKVTYTPDMCPRTLSLLGRAIHMDVSPDLTDQNLEELADALNKVLNTF